MQGGAGNIAGRRRRQESDGLRNVFRRTQPPQRDMTQQRLALCIRQRTLPPTLGLHVPIAPLSFVRHAETGVPVRWGLVNAVSSGGTFAALVLKSVQPSG